MTTPDPITTAREALYALVADSYHKDTDDIQDITAAFDYAEKLKAERDEWKSSAANMGQQGIGLMAEITVLTSQLEQAERVIKPFADAAKSLTGSEDDDAIIAPAFMDEPPLGSCDLVVCCIADLRTAAQWIKDRQAKGEG